METLDKWTLAHSSGATINLDDDPLPFPEFWVWVEQDSQVEEILLKLNVCHATPSIEINQDKVPFLFTMTKLSMSIVEKLTISR